MPCNLYRCELPLVKPLVTSQGTISARTVWVVEVTDGNGRIGLGEAAPLPGFGGEDPEACDRVLNQTLLKLTPELVGRWIEKGRPDAPLGMQIEPLLQQFPCARHAIEGAFIDLLANSQGIPVSSLLVESAAVVVPVNALVDGPEQAKAAVETGFRTVKAKAEADPNRAAAFALSLRSAVGSKVQLRIDANGCWDGDQAVAFVQGSQLANLEWVEQPLAVDQLEAMAGLRRRAHVRIALDESVRNVADVGRVGAAQAANAVVLKPMFLGGWRPTKQAIELAASCGLDVVFSSAIEGSIGRAYATHMAAALNLTAKAHGLATGDRFGADLTSEPLLPKAGNLMVRERPGLGVGTLGG